MRVFSSGNLSAIDKVAGEILQAIQTLAPNMYRYSNTEQVLEKLRMLPYAAALVKLHKTPLQFRFLACSGMNGLRPVALWLNALLKTVHYDLCKVWSQLLNRLHVLTDAIDWKHLPPWYATRSAEVVAMVKFFNKLCMSTKEFTAGFGWQGYDVVRLYTNIPQDDLVQSLSNLLGELVWDAHEVQRNGPRHRLLQVFKDDTYGASWLDADWNLADVADSWGSYWDGAGAGIKTDRWGIDGSKGDFYLFDWQEVKNVITLLVKYSFVRFGDQIWHQQIGIPMGINPAVYMANYYLFYYEYRFVQQFVGIFEHYPPVQGGQSEARALFESDDLHDAPIVDSNSDPLWVGQWPQTVDPIFKGSITLYVLNKFKLMKRFVDDVTSGPNPFLRHLLNRRNTILGGLIHGIYPDCLALDQTHAGCWSFPTLDIRIVSCQVLHAEAAGVVHDATVESYTILYDKRREKCYDGIPIVQYMHVSSSISSNVTNSILLGQLHRFRELIMCRQNYVLESALLLWRMVKRGYKRQILFAKLRRHLKQYPDTYKDITFRPLLKDVMDTFYAPNIVAHFHTGAPLHL